MYSADIEIENNGVWIRMCVGFDAPTLKGLKSTIRQYVKNLHPTYKGKIRVIDLWQFVEKKHKNITL